MKEAFFIRGKHQRSGKWQKKKKNEADKSRCKQQSHQLKDIFISNGLERNC